MLSTKISIFGEPHWLVSRRCVDELRRAEAGCKELHGVQARWALQDAWQSHALGAVHAAEFIGASVGRPRQATLQQLLQALSAGGLAVFRQATPAIEAICGEPEALISDEGLAPLEAHWIEVRLLDESDNPRAGEAYRVVLADHSEVTGRLDVRGVARIRNIPGGHCHWSFPDLCPDEWGQAS
ncbi:MAG: hypothetical protein JKY37_09290 [Nannocystaceae bacterium]|nr:hypothetical protein [Nannocystaceae bacterium]